MGLESGPSQRSVLQRTVINQSSATKTADSGRAGEGLDAPAALSSKLAKTLGAMLRTPPHLRGAEVIEEIEHALTKWSRYGVDMPRAIRLELCKYMGFASFGAGDTIFKQGDVGQHFYIILSGAVDVSVYGDEDPKEEKVVAHLLAGASFGELALMQGHGQRRATCRCSQKSELFVVDIKDFKRILQPLQQDTLQTKIGFLQQLPLFQGIPAATIESLAVVLTEKVYPPKSVVYYQGNEVEDLFFIQRGHVKMVRETEMGTDMQPGISHRSAVRPSTVPASSIPSWLADSTPKPSRASRSARRSHEPVLCSKGRSKRSQDPADDAAALPTYHKLSVDLIKSMSGDKVNSKLALDMGATMSRSTLSTSTRRPAGSAGSKHTLHPAGSVFHGTIRPGSGHATQRRPTTLKFDPDADLPDQENEASEAAAAKQGKRLMSEQTLNKQVVQQLDFTKNLKAQKHLFLEVDYMGKAEFFGDVSVTKTPVAQTTAVAAGMTTILLVISKWDLVKRVPKEVLDYLAERAKASAVDDIAVRSQYVACQDWLRFRQELVADVVHQHKVKSFNNPIYIWSGSFRDQIPCKNSAQALWRPTGLAQHRRHACF